jgi:hypothetical protein
MTFSPLNAKALPPNTVALGTELSTHDFEGDKAVKPLQVLTYKNMQGHDLFIHLMHLSGIAIIS